MECTYTQKEKTEWYTNLHINPMLLPTKSMNGMTRAMAALLPSFLSILMITMASAGVTNDQPAAALLAFRAGLRNHSSSVLASWNSSTSVCAWEGVACNGRRPAQVVALRLPFRGLAGTISPAIGNLTFLRTLNLSSNGFYGEIPPSIGRLRRLRTLDMGNNLLSGMLPANLTFCTSLETLILDYNRLTVHIATDIGDTLTRIRGLSLVNNTFTGPIPQSLGNLSSLQWMSLQENLLQGPIPTSLGNLNNLQFLNLEDNGLSGVIPLSVYNLSSLTFFAVGGNKLHGHIPVDIGKRFPRMQLFSVGANRFSGAIPSSISNLTALTRLYLSQNRFSGFVPPTLGRMQPLTILFLHDTEVEANDKEGWEFITSMANCSQLEILLIGNNSFSGQLPSSIANLSTTLQSLYLGYNNITGSIPPDIGNLVGLNILEIEHTFMSGVIPDSIGRLVNLVQLGLDNNRFTGLIPPSIGNLTQIEWLLASNNSLEGPIPTSLGKLKNLDLLDLSMNYNLNGSIPKEIFGLTFLSSYLDLSYNLLSGPLPTEVGGLKNLNKLVLSENQLSGDIPDSIGNCIVLEFLLLNGNSFKGTIPQSLQNVKGLRILNLTMNKLSGVIPESIASISGLEQLYLAHNNFSGAIPAAIQNLTFLSKMDVSFNSLQGEVPKGGVFGNITYLSIAGNGKLCGGMSQLHLVPCPTGNKGNKGNRKKWSKSLTVALITTGVILFFVAVIFLVQLICKKMTERQKDPVTPAVIEDKYQKISYYELSRGTNGFSEANLLGKGRYGAVYKCTSNDEHANITMAVKVFDLQQLGSSRSFETECEALSRARHRCLIKIITCCSSIDSQGQKFKALIFEFMPNGSLDNWLHPKSENHVTKSTLSLAQRLDIAVDIVDAIDYLHNHCDPQIIHCDLKPSNILLAEDMSAHVGDFGISKVLSDNTIDVLQNSNSIIRGSIGYVAPEYGEGSAISTTGDLYSLGILLLEMFTGIRPTNDMFRESLDLHKFVEASLRERTLDVADSAIWLHVESKDSITMSRIKECLVSIFRLAISCSKQHPRERMTIRDATVEMHTIRDSYLISSELEKTSLVLIGKGSDHS